MGSWAPLLTSATTHGVPTISRWAATRPTARSPRPKARPPTLPAGRRRLTAAAGARGAGYAAAGTEGGTRPAGGTGGAGHGTQCIHRLGILCYLHIGTARLTRRSPARPIVARRGVNGSLRHSHSRNLYRRWAPWRAACHTETWPPHTSAHTPQETPCGGFRLASLRQSCSAAAASPQGGMQTWRRWPPMLVPAVAAVGAARVSARRGTSTPRRGEGSPNATMPMRGDPARGLGTLSARERRRYVASRRMRAAPLHPRGRRRLRCILHLLELPRRLARLLVRRVALGAQPLLVLRRRADERPALLRCCRSSPRRARRSPPEGASELIVSSSARHPSRSAASHYARRSAAAPRCHLGDQHLEPRAPGEPCSSAARSS